MDIKQTVSEIKRRLITNNDLLLRAANFKGVFIEFENNSLLQSDPFSAYQLVGAFLRALEKKGFRLDYRKDGIATLYDESKEGGYWNFRNRDGEKDELLLKLCVSIRINESKRGVILWPWASGTFLSSIEPSSNFKIFEAVVDHDEKADSLVKEMVKEKGEIIVSWAQLGLGGLRSVPVLFEEFSSFAGTRRSTVEHLALSSVSPLDPNPMQKEKLFLPEPYQLLLFELWRTQLDEFRRSIPR